MDNLMIIRYLLVYVVVCFIDFIYGDKFIIPQSICLISLFNKLCNFYLVRTDHKISFRYISSQLQNWLLYNVFYEQSGRSDQKEDEMSGGHCQFTHFAIHSQGNRNLFIYPVVLRRMDTHCSICNQAQEIKDQPLEVWTLSLHYILGDSALFIRAG